MQIFFLTKIKETKIHEFILISNDVPSFSAHCLEIDPGRGKKLIYDLKKLKSFKFLFILIALEIKERF